MVQQDIILPYLKEREAEKIQCVTRPKTYKKPSPL